MTYAIQAENLGKRYLIGHQRKESYSTLRDTISHGVKNLANRILHPQMNSSGSELEEFWALHDVNFEVQPGDRVGIIGRNGAGKSTLLKILSRITEPTTGRFTTLGRVAALLEVGTGFHPELSGRENIYLNGAILGMSRSDVKRQFDAIVEFAGVEKFLDTPVKRYSSGMYVRLAFAVAAHLEPDILIVDEVLAVGDAEFQKKCLGKMEEVGKEGRTVVFVSHNMSAVRRLCDKGMVMEGGGILIHDDINLSLEHYTATQNVTAESAVFMVSKNASRQGNQNVTLKSFWIEDTQKRVLDQIPIDAPITLVFNCQINSPNVKYFDIGVSIHDIYGTQLATIYSSYQDKLFKISNQLMKIYFHIKEWPFGSGNYSFGFRILADGLESDWLSDHTASFNSVTTSFTGIKNPDQLKSKFIIKGIWSNCDEIHT